MGCISIGVCFRRCTSYYESDHYPYPTQDYLMQRRVIIEALNAQRNLRQVQTEQSLKRLSSHYGSSFSWTLFQQDGSGVAVLALWCPGAETQMEKYRRKW